MLLNIEVEISRPTLGNIHLRQKYPIFVNNSSFKVTKETMEARIHPELAAQGQLLRAMTPRRGARSTRRSCPTRTGTSPWPSTPATRTRTSTI